MKKTSKYFFLLVIVAILTYLNWFSFDIFASSDWLFIFSDSLSKFTYSYLWFSFADLGSVNITLWRFMLVFSQSLFADSGYSLNVSEKILVFWPTIIFANIFSFALIKKIIKSNTGAFIGAIVFNYNTYYLVIGSGFLIYAAASWILLSLLIFIKAIETEKKYLYTICGLTLFIAGSYDFRIAYIGIFILFFYSFYYIFFIKNDGVLIKSLRSLFFSFITFLVFGLLNIYWILPMLKLGSLSSNAVLDRGLFGGQFLNISYAITLYHPFWTGTKTAWFNITPIMIYFWVIPILAFLGLWLNRKNKNILFFGVIALLGIFLTKQIAIPFKGVYPWLFENFPGFNAFREASKFYFLIALGYAVLIGGLVSYIFENYKNIKIYFKYAFATLIVLLFLWNTKPFITGEIGSIYVPRHIPNDYLIIKDFILKDRQYYRTFWVPSMSTWSIYTTNHPEISMTSILPGYDYWNNSLKAIPVNMYSFAEIMAMALKLENSNNLLDISSVKYVFIPIRDLVNDQDFFVFFGKSRQYYIDQLNKISYLKKIDIGTKEIVVYENKDFRPHIYATAEKETIYKDLRPTIYDVKYKFVNPTEYKVSLKNVKTPFYLNFSESYHPQWNVYLGDFKWYSVLLNKQKAISNKNHFKNDAGLNSYVLDPKSICKQSACVQNKDGSHNINMTLYFASQSYMYFGGIISLTTLFGVLSYLGYIGFSKLKK